MFTLCYFLTIFSTFCVDFDKVVVPPPPIPKAPVIQVLKNCSLDAVSYAVARQETGGCTTGVGRTQNNCHGFRKKGVYLTFNSPEESHAYFKALWKNAYGGGCPTLAHAEKYVSTSGATYWLQQVNKFIIQYKKGK